MIMEHLYTVCLQDCSNNVACFYFTYAFDDDLCVQFSECDNLVDTDKNQTSSGHVSICDLNNTRHVT